jgi:hypothetical protein
MVDNDDCRQVYIEYTMVIVLVQQGILVQIRRIMAKEK